MARPHLSSPRQTGAPADMPRCGGPSTHTSPTDGEPCQTMPTLLRRRKSAGRRSNGAEWAALSAQPRTPPRSPGPQLRSPPRPPAEEAAPRQPPLAGPLLVAAAQLIRNFSQASPAGLHPPDCVQDLVLPQAQPVPVACTACSTDSSHATPGHDP